MTWVKIDDQLAEHPKILQAGPEASWLFITGLCYCAQYLTDGHIPIQKVRRLADGMDCESIAVRLFEVDLWDECDEHDDCVFVPAYLDYNPSAEKTKRRREQRKQAARSGGKKRAQKARRSKDGTFQKSTKPAEPPAESAGPAAGKSAGTADQPPASPVPVPVPVPIDQEQRARGREKAPSNWGTAWRNVQTQVHRYGRIRARERPRLDDLTEQAIEACGGFAAICSGDPYSMKFEFRDAWKDVA